MSNYRPIANLCAVTKIFERLILQRIQEIEDEQNVDITGTNQHGFKRGRSTTTAGLAIQSALARALDEGQYALMANLDLSSAFDVVNINLLLKRMRIVGLPNDIIKLVEIWLKDRKLFVNNLFYYEKINFLKKKKKKKKSLLSILIPIVREN